MSDLVIESWKIGRLKRYARNSRAHSPEQIAQIKASMREFGFTNPILVDAKGVIIAGHGRLHAAEEMGMKTVPVIKLAHLSDTQAAALRIADNSLPLNASWDTAMLKEELATLEALDFDLEPLGLDQIELPAQIEMPQEHAPPPSPKTKTTLFVSVKVSDLEKAKAVVRKALDRAKIEHNL
jgi:hypothetical protein